MSVDVREGSQTESARIDNSDAFKRERCPHVTDIRGHDSDGQTPTCPKNFKPSRRALGEKKRKKIHEESREDPCAKNEARLDV